MLIGILGSSVMIGLVAGITALVLGQSFLAALWVYTVVGVVAALALALLITVVSVVQKRRPEQPSFTQ
jgi:xanthine/uracil/vitamin C permease (AzgA family)